MKASPTKRTELKLPTRIEEDQLFVHDITVNLQSPYPCDLPFAAILPETLASLKSAHSFLDMKSILCESSCSVELLKNLFWICFSLQFQIDTFPEVVVRFLRERTWKDRSSTRRR